MGGGGGRASERANEGGKGQGEREWAVSQPCKDKGSKQARAVERDRRGQGLKGVAGRTRLRDGPVDSAKAKRERARLTFRLRQAQRWHGGRRPRTCTRGFRRRPGATIGGAEVCRQRWASEGRQAGGSSEKSAAGDKGGATQDGDAVLLRQPTHRMAPSLPRRRLAALSVDGAGTHLDALLLGSLGGGGGGSLGGRGSSGGLLFGRHDGCFVRKRWGWAGGGEPGGGKCGLWS